MRFRILGPLIVSDDYGAELRVPQQMQRALLCTLLLHQNQVIRASRLAGLLWGADIPRQRTRRAADSCLGGAPRAGAREAAAQGRKWLPP